LLILSTMMPSLAYAFIYQQQSFNITQTIKKAWYDRNWQYRKAITILGSKVSDPNTHSFDATGGYILIGDGTPNWGSTRGTISFWIKWDTVGGRPWGQHDNMEIRFSGSRLVLDWGATGSLTSSTTFTAGKWYFIAVVWNENTDKLYLYVGDENTSPALDASNNAWRSTVSNQGVTQNNFMASKGGVGRTDGKGDELRYWDIDRTIEQIQSDYKTELTGTEANLRSYFKLNNNFDDIGVYNNDGSGVGSYQFSISVPIMDTYLADFPVLISIIDSDLASDAQDDGDDILFTSSDKKTKLSHEIEAFNGQTGQLIAWVRIPKLFANNDTIIYMYYGNPTASNQQDAVNVWDSNYVGVWHFKETVGGTSAIKDSKGVNHGTDSGGPTLGVAGKIGNAIQFDGVDDCVIVPDHPSLHLGSGLTIEAWINIDIWGNWKDIVFKGGGAGDNSDYQFALVSDGLAWDGTYNGNWRAKYFQTSQDTGTWIHVAVTHDTFTVKCYRDGAEISSQPDAGAIYESSYELGISKEGAANTGYLHGKIDELRISKTPRSRPWIETEYNNQNNPSSFYNIGLEETH